MAKNDKIKIVILILLWAVVFCPLYPELVREWLGNSDNSHAFIVPLISMYFVWQRKYVLQHTPVTTSVWGGGLLAVSLLLYILSSAGGLAFPARVTMVTSLFGLFWFCLGKEFIQKIAFPIAFLLFMVPVPYSLISLVSAPLVMSSGIQQNIERFWGRVLRNRNDGAFVQVTAQVPDAKLVDGAARVQAFSGMVLTLLPDYWPIEK